MNTDKLKENLVKKERVCHSEQLFQKETDKAAIVTNNGSIHRSPIRGGTPRKSEQTFFSLFTAPYSNGGIRLFES